jgi:HK97 family phage major capsid protein
MDTTKMENLRTKGVALRSDIRKLITKPNASQRDLDRVAELSEDADALESAYRAELETALRAAKSSALPSIAMNTHNTTEKAEAVRNAFGLRAITPSSSGFGRAEWSQSIVSSLDLPTFLTDLRGVVRHDITEPELKVAVITADNTAAVVAAGGSATIATPTTVLKTLSPYRVATIVEIAREVVEAMPDTALTSFGDSVVKSVQRKVEDLAINGSGSSQPTGILNTSGAWGLALGTAMTNLDFIAEAAYKVNSTGAKANTLLTSPKVAMKLLQLKSATSGSNLPLLAANAANPAATGIGTGETLFGLDIVISDSVPENGGAGGSASYVAVFDATQLHLAFQRPSTGTGVVELVRSSEGNFFVTDTVGLRATARMDLTFANPLALCIVSGISVA